MGAFEPRKMVVIVYGETTERVWSFWGWACGLFPHHSHTLHPSFKLREETMLSFNKRVFIGSHYGATKTDIRGELYGCRPTDLWCCIASGPTPCLDPTVFRRENPCDWVDATGKYHKNAGMKYLPASPAYWIDSNSSCNNSKPTWLYLPPDIFTADIR